MHHDISLIATVAVGFVLASVFGYFADRLRLPAISLEVAGKDSAAAMQEALGAKLRPVPVSPGLLAYLDTASRARVLARWNAALEGVE